MMMICCKNKEFRTIICRRATPIVRVGRLYAAESVTLSILNVIMKYLLPALIVLLLASCKKEEDKPVPMVPTPTGPLSRFNITFNGKTYNEVEDGLHPVRLDTVFKGKNPTTGKREYQLQLYWETRNLLITIGGQKEDTSSALGTYTTTLSGSALPIPVSSPNTITVFGDTTRPYVGNATSTVTITSWNDGELKGTISFKLHNSGVAYPATGDFEFYK